MHLDISYCSSEEILHKCKLCIRNDNNRLKAVSESDLKSRVTMTYARPFKRGAEEICDLYKELRDEKLEE